MTAKQEFKDRLKAFQTATYELLTAWGNLEMSDEPLPNGEIPNEKYFLSESLDEFFHKVVEFREDIEQHPDMKDTPTQS